MTERIRVLHIADKFGVKGSSITGVGRLFEWWIPRFDSHRFDVGLVGLRHPDNSSQALEKQNIHPRCLGKHRLDPTTIAALAREAKEFGAQILHLHGYGASNFGLLTAPLVGAKTVVHEHFVDPGMPGYQRIADRLLIGRADLGMANCDAVKTFMVEKRCFQREKVEVVYNGAPLRDFFPVAHEQATELRSRLGIPQGNAVLATIGRLDEQKGVRYLLDAAAILKQSGAAFTLIVVGDGPHSERLQEQSRTLGLGDIVIFVGFQQDVRPYMQIADIQVIPSLWEGTTLTVFEAMAMEKTIVSTDADGLAEVLSDGETALLVPPGDSPALAAAIAKAMQDAPLSARLATQAKEASAKYDIQATVETLQRAYYRLLGRPIPA